MVHIAVFPIRVELLESREWVVPFFVDLTLGIVLGMQQALKCCVSTLHPFAVNISQLHLCLSEFLRLS